MNMLPAYAHAGALIDQGEPSELHNIRNYRNATDYGFV